MLAALYEENPLGVTLSFCSGFLIFLFLSFFRLSFNGFLLLVYLFDCRLLLDELFFNSLGLAEDLLEIELGLFDKIWLNSQHDLIGFGELNIPIQNVLNVVNVVIKLV